LTTTLSILDNVKDIRTTVRRRRRKRRDRQVDERSSGKRR
jgi:hypothetical protein